MVEEPFNTPRIRRESPKAAGDVLVSTADMMDPMRREVVGIVVAKVRMSSADRLCAQALELIVDTGSTLTWVPARPPEP